MQHKNLAVFAAIYLSAIVSPTAALEIPQQPPLDVTLKPFTSTLNPLLNNDKATGAVFSSTMSMGISHPVLNLVLDYDLEGNLQPYDSSFENDMAQRFKASLKSNLIARYLKLDAAITADSQTKVDDDSYRYSFTPSLKKSLDDLADLQLDYRYSVDKSATAIPQETQQLTFALSGVGVSGNLSWNSRYQAAKNNRPEGDVPDSIESLYFSSGYKLLPELNIELSGATVVRERYSEQQLVESRELRYAAGFSWSPAQDYTISMTVNKLSDTESATDSYFSSGRITWSLLRSMKVFVDYGDQLVEGVRGLKLGTSLDLDLL